MRLFLKIFFWTSVAFIATCLLIGILGLFFQIEFIDYSTAIMFNKIPLYGIPISILLTLTGTLKTKDSTQWIIGKILITLGVLLTAVIIGFMSTLNPCGWMIGDTLFTKKGDSIEKIQVRDYDCGAVDSDKPNYRIFKIEKFGKYFLYTSEVDTNKINKSDWIRVKNEKEKYR
jgi:hypothetical protein